MYKCLKPRLEGSENPPVQWSSKNVRSSFLSAWFVISCAFYLPYPHISVLEVSHSLDGEEIVFVATYSAKESSKSQQDVKFAALICLGATNLEVRLSILTS